MCAINSLTTWWRCISYVVSWHDYIIFPQPYFTDMHIAHSHSHRPIRLDADFFHSAFSSPRNLTERNEEKKKLNKRNACAFSLPIAVQLSAVIFARARLFFLAQGDQDYALSRKCNIFFSCGAFNFTQNSAPYSWIPAKRWCNDSLRQWNECDSEYWYIFRHRVYTCTIDFH